jgi:hypothetical protein
MARVLASRSGRHAAELSGAAASLRATIGAARPPADEDAWHRARSLARATMGDEAFAAAERQGRTLSTEQAIARALIIAGDVW